MGKMTMDVLASGNCGSEAASMIGVSKLEKSIKKVPWKPEIKDKEDTKHFDDYDENTDTEDAELDNDPFENDF